MDHIAKPAVPSIPGVSVEDYFNQLPRLEEQIASCRQKQTAVSLQLYSLASASDFSNPKTQSQPPADPDAFYTRLLEKKEALEARLDKLCRLSQALKEQATALILRYTSGRENLVITSRYLCKKEWLEIARIVADMTGKPPLSPKQLRRICRAGMDKIILPENAIRIGNAGKAA